MRRTALLTVLLLALSALSVHAQTTSACDQNDDPLFVLAPGDPGLTTFGFAHATAENASVTLYRLRIYDLDAAPTAAPLSVQDVTKAAATFLGTSPATGQGCYQLPLVPVAQIPRGKRLAMTIQAVGAIPELSALESGRGDPFGSRLNPTGAPQRRP